MGLTTPRIHVDEYIIEPMIQIFERKINGRTYYHAETSLHFDFEFDDKTLIKITDVRKGKSYHPNEYAQWLNDNDNPLSDLYNEVNRTLYLYFNEKLYYRAKLDRNKLIHRNLETKLRREDSKFLKEVPNLKKGCLNRPRFDPTHLNSNYSFIATLRNKFELSGTSIEDIRKWCIIMLERDTIKPYPFDIYRLSSKGYEYVGTVRYGTVGRYLCTHFMNKNGIFQMDEKGHLKGALYRW